MTEESGRVEEILHMAELIKDATDSIETNAEEIDDIGVAALISKGLTPTKAVDYYFTVEMNLYTKSEWAEVRQCEKSAVVSNVARAHKILSGDDE